VACVTGSEPVVSSSRTRDQPVGPLPSWAFPRVGAGAPGTRCRESAPTSSHLAYLPNMSHQAPSPSEEELDRRTQRDIARSTNWTNVIIAVIGALVSLGTFLLGLRVGGGDTQAVPQSPYDAGAILTPKAPEPNKTVQIRSNVQTIAVSGSLKKPLPSGTQIWVANRISFDNNDEGALDYADVAFSPGPCKVDPSAMTYDCGQVNLGNPKEPGRYYIFVMLADSNSSKKIVDIMINQSSKGNYRNPAPDGVSTLDAAIVERL